MSSFVNAIGNNDNFHIASFTGLFATVRTMNVLHKKYFSTMKKLFFRTYD